MRTRKAIVILIAALSIALGSSMLMCSSRRSHLTDGTPRANGTVLEWNFVDGHDARRVGWTTPDDTWIWPIGRRQVVIRVPTGQLLALDSWSIQLRRNGPELSSVSVGFDDEDMKAAYTRAKHWAQVLGVEELSRINELAERVQSGRNPVGSSNSASAVARFAGWGVGLHLRPSYDGVGSWHLTLVIGFE